MHGSLFFKLFPPPQFLLRPHAGLDISDDALHCLQYRLTTHGFVISKYASQELPAGVVVGGEVKDQQKFLEILSDFVKKNDLGDVKVSLPEEKAYLFQTDVPSSSFRSIAQNIESKLEQNIPLPAREVLFQFDLLPRIMTGDNLKASVSVLPRSYIENYVSLLRSAGLNPVAFEVVPKAIAEAFVSDHSGRTSLIVYVGKKKTGLYIISEGVVCFTSTINWGSDDLPSSQSSEAPNLLIKEIDRVYLYWQSHDQHINISEITVVGSKASECQTYIQGHSSQIGSSANLPNIWHNVFNLEDYIPPIAKADSYPYAIAAGLAL